MPGETAMNTINVIVPVCHIGPDWPSRVCTINGPLSSFLSYQEHPVKLIIVHQKLDASEPDMLVNTSVETVYRSVVSSRFNKPWLYNVGALLADGENLILAEADCVGVGPTLSRMVDVGREYKELQWGFCWNKLIYVSEADSKQVKAGTMQLRGVFGRETRPKPGGPEGGLLWIRKSFFKKIGGMNELFYGLGGMDNEFAARCYAATHTYYKHPTTLYHFWHQGSAMKRDATRKVNKLFYRYTRSAPVTISKRLSTKQWGGQQPLAMNWKEILLP